MDREAIKELLRTVLGPNVPLIDHPKWVGMHCPLAPWTHAGGKDSMPSAGVSVQDTGGTSIFNCLGCHSRGPISYLLKELEKYTGDNHSKLIREIEHNEFLGGPLPEWSKGTRGKAARLSYLDKDTYLDLYDSAEGHWYLADRGISDDTARRLTLLVDPCDSQHEERILFPVMDRQQRLLGFSGRATDRRAELRVRDYHGLPKAHCLLGEHLIDPAKDEYVVVVEGLFDYATCWEYDEPAVAVMHSSVTEHQYRSLLNLGLPLVFMFDNDEAGYGALEKATKMFSGKLPISEARYPRRGAKIGGVKVPARKDPGACTCEEIKWMIRNARIL